MWSRAPVMMMLRRGAAAQSSPLRFIGSSNNRSTLICFRRSSSNHVRAISSVVQQHRSDCHQLLSPLSPNSNNISKRWNDTSTPFRLLSTATAAADPAPDELPPSEQFVDFINNKKPSQIRILYASQTGTAQLFAMQLAEALGDASSETTNDHAIDVTTAPMNDVNVADMLQHEQTEDADPWYVFLVSTAGVGEAPDNGRAFYKQLLQQLQQQQGSSTAPVLQGIKYSIFALGNSKAHSAHYCAFGKDLQKHLQSAGAMEILPMAMGDDGGDCLEDDFDRWQDVFLKRLEQVGSEEAGTAEAAPTTLLATAPVSTSSSTVPSKSRQTNYPELRLENPDPDTRHLITAASDLVEKAPSFYAEGTQRYPVPHNRVLRSDSPDAATNPAALREMQIALQPDDSYVTGDHLIVYPRNSDVLVEAYLNVLKDRPDPHAVIQGTVAAAATSADGTNKPYPHPVGITIYETLRHCVDLQALPSPSFARWLTGMGRELDYKQDILAPRRTVLELLLESDEPYIAVRDLLYQLPPLQPRYYSIASSDLAHPDTIYLTYRPVKYMTTKGSVREGVSTSYLSGIPDNSQHQQTVTAAIRSNPTFRLPVTAPGSTPPPILLLAGGCGVAPIRAFLEELCWNARQPKPKPYGPVHLFLGFRNPDDAVYAEFVSAADSLGLLAGQYITYTTGCAQCALVSDAVVAQGANLHKLLTQDGAVTYICGGARTFGVAIQNAIHGILSEEGGMSESEATAFLQELIKSGRFHEDLSD